MTSRLATEYRNRAVLGMPYNDIRDQMPVLYAWARRAAKVIELGVRTGNSTSAFLAALEGRGELWSVDVNPPLVPDYWLDLPNWHFLQADDISAQALDFCPDRVDVLFIDTSHYYEHTMAELKMYVPKVRPGGVVLLHDTVPYPTDLGVGWPDVSAALNASGLDWYDHPGWPGLGVIEIPEIYA